jgi:hypothetical protein
VNALVLAALLATTPDLAAPPQPSPRRWTTSDIVLEGTFVALVFVDWRQTTAALFEGDGYGREMNPILGERPSRARLNTLVAGAVVGHALVTHLLPTGARPYWQYFTIGFEGATVLENFRAGARFTF